MIRSIIFHILYWKNKLMLRNIRLKGYCVIFSFPGSKIKMGGYDKLLFHKQYAWIVATHNHGGPLWWKH